MTKLAIEQRLQAQSKLWDTLIALLYNSVYGAEAGMRTACIRDYHTLCAKRTEAAEKLALLKAKEDDSWQDLGPEVDRIWRDMAEAARDLVDRLH